MHVKESTSIGHVASGTVEVPVLAVTSKAIACAGPILYENFADCRVPGGKELWAKGGFYSPGMCFEGYTAGCTGTMHWNGGFPIREDAGETAVKCVPTGYVCNAANKDHKYAISKYGETILSAPAFEIRWRSEDLEPAKTSTAVSTVNLDTDLSSKTAASTLTSTSSTLAATPTPSGTSVAVPAPTPGSGPKLSSGSIVGIAVSSTFAILAIGFTIVFFALRRHKSRQSRQNQPVDRAAAASPIAPANIEPAGPQELENSPIEPKEMPVDTELSPSRRTFSHPFREGATPLTPDGRAVELPA